MPEDPNNVQAQSSPKEDNPTKNGAKAKKPELDSKTIEVKIFSPFKVYFSGPASSISAENETGPFDVLPKHHNFITLLNPGDIIVRTDVKEQRFRIARGVMHVKNNAIIIFLDV